jgi:hypothetical protein
VSATATEAKRPGRPPGCDRDLVIRMYQLHCGQGLSYERISALLNTEGIPLPGDGSRWLRSSVERVMNTNYGREIGRELGFC